MNICLRTLLPSLCVAAALAQNYGCKKGSDDKAANASINPPDSSAKASRNCVDSIAGIYYGTGIRWGTVHRSGADSSFSYLGPDTLIVVKGGVNGICVHSNHTARTDCFEFDSSKTMVTYGSLNSSTTEATLDYNSAGDSVIYRYRYQTPEEGTFCGFSGRK